MGDSSVRKTHYPSLRRRLVELERLRSELQRSEGYLSEAQRVSHTGSFGWSISSGEIYWSEETFRIFQYDRTMKPTMELVLQRVHPDDVPLWKQAIERVSQDGKDYGHEYRLLMPDGSVKYLHVLAHAQRDKSGEIEFVGAVTDVTAAKRAEEKLRHSERELRSAIETIPVMAFTASPNGRTAFRNRRWREYTGLPAEDTEGFGWQSAIHPGDRERHMEKWRACSARGEPCEDEVRFRRAADGEYRWFLFRTVPLRDETGNILKWYGVLIDIEDRKQAGQALRRSEAYLAEAQRLSHIGSFAYNPGSGKALYWSEELFRIFGLDPRRGIPDPSESYGLLHPDDRDRVSESCLQGFREKADFSQDYKLLLHDGTIKHLHVIWHPVLDKNGEVVEYVGTAADVTERKLAEEKVRQSEEELRQLIDAIPQQVFVFDADWNPLFANRRELEYSGLTSQEMGSRDAVARIFHPEDLKKLEVARERARSDGAPIEMEARIRGKDGEYRWFLIRDNPLRDEQGRVLRWYGTRTDIEDRKRAEEELRESETRFRTFVDYAADAFFLHDQEHNVFDVNRQACEYLGYTREELIGMDPLDFDPDMDAARLQRIREQLAAGEGLTFETRHRRKDGTVFPVEVRLRYFWRGGRRLHLALVRDITERKRSEEQRDKLRQLEADLAHVNRVTTMGELTASLAHEVNQPIAAAITDANTCLRWLTRDQPDLEEARAAASRTAKDGMRAGEIIRRIRLLFKKATPQWELVAVNEVIREMIALLHSQATQYSISVRTELAEDIPQVMGDRVQLQQVIMNLIVNSIDAMKDVDGAREVTIKSQQGENDQVLVSVSDTGVGLPSEQADQIFTAFFTTKAHGTGMGLRISRTIVESHGGRMWAANNSTRGASFYFTLPAKAEARE